MTTTGILFFLLLGGLVFFAFGRIISFTKSRKSELRFLVLLYLSIFLIGFGLAWCYTSFLENEPRAAYMGLIVFCGLGLVLGLVGIWNMMDFQTAAVDQASGEVSPAISWKKAVAAVLMVVFAITLPAAWLFKSATGIVSDREQVSSYLGENIVSDKALPGVIKKGLEYEAWLTRIEEPLMSRVIKSAISGIKRQNMLELFDYIAPEKERLAMLNDATTALYDWIEGEAPYPTLTLQTGVYLNNIESNAENLVLWMFRNFPIPACGPVQIGEFEQGVYGNDLKKLISCIPPESLQKKIAPIAAALLKAQLAENSPPEVVDVGAKMKEAPVKKIATAKLHLNRLFLAGSTLWLMPVALLLIGLGLVVRSRKDLAVWLSWPFFITGLLGLFIGARLPGLSFLHSVPHEAEVPGAVVGIGRKIGIDLAVMLESAMFTPFLILAVAGGVMLAITRREKIMSMAVRMRLSLGMVFGKQAV
jgi:hypothetical protein